MMFGIAPPTFATYTINTHYRMTEFKFVSADIIRELPLATTRQYLKIGNHLKVSYSIYELDYSDIQFLRGLRGTVVNDFRLHSDNNETAPMIVLYANERRETLRPEKYVIDISFLSVDFYEPSYNPYPIP